MSENQEHHHQTHKKKSSLLPPNFNLQQQKKASMDKSSSSKDSSSSESFDMSSEINPYESSDSSSSDSNSNQSHEDASQEKQISQKLPTLHSIEKSKQNIMFVLSYYLHKESNFPEINMNISKMIKKLNIPKFDMVLLYISACFKDREYDQQVLLEKIKLKFFEQSDKNDNEKLAQIIYSLVDDQVKNDKVKIAAIFIEHSTYFMQRVLEDKYIYYELFQDIIQSGDINMNLLIPKLYIPTSTLYILLNEKKYDQLLFLVKNNIRIMHTSMISFTSKHELTYEGYLNKPLLKVNLKLYALFYTDKVKDNSMIKKFLLEIRQSSQEYKELLKVFVRYKHNSLAKDIYKALIDCNHNFDYKILNFSLMVQFNQTIIYQFNLFLKNQNQNLEFLWFLGKQQNVILTSWLNEETTQKILVDQLYSIDGVYFEYLIYYLKRVKRFKVKQTIKRMCETLIFRMQTCRKGQFLYTFYNPLKVSLVVMELLCQTKEKVVHHTSRLNKAIELYYKFVQTYCSLVTDDSLMIDIFKDIDLEKRKVIYLINNNNSGILQSNQIVEDAIESMWNGNVVPQANLLKMFTITQNLFFSEMSDYIIEKDPKKNQIFMMINKNYQNHHFSLQRVVWTYNCRIRNQIDQCLILILMALIFMNFSSLFQPQYDLQFLLSANNYNYDDVYDQELEIIRNLKNVYFTYQIILDIIIGFNFTFKPIFILYFDWTQKAQTKFSVQDFFCFLLGILSFMQWGFISNIEDIEEPIRFDILIVFRSIYMAIVIVQCVFAIKNFKVFGPMVKALWLVVLECSKFSFIFVLVILLFGFLAYFSFFENINGRFTTLDQALLFLIEALFGQFAFSDFNQPSPIYAPIFLNVYLFFMPIIFMQLLVAVLTFTFEAASRSGRIHYFLGTIENLKNLEYDPINGCLVAIPIVGNFINIIFILTHMLSDPDPSMKEQNIDTLKKVNKFLVRLGYFPIYAIFTIFCVLMIIVFSPIFYIVKFFRILNETNKEEGYSKGKRLIKWILLGYYYMLIQTIQDFKTNYQYLMHGKYVNINNSPHIDQQNNQQSMLASLTKNCLKNMEKQTAKLPLPSLH
ncbi:hypothetical protein ABPG74_022548 [Tetrahymena malaccensis]